ncbi:MAG: TOBE domain-containing protein [Eubacteriaceae bacterium]|jgi:molybdopterin-binding protein
MKLSARNQLKGTITEIEMGAVNAVIKLDIGGGQKMASTITIDAVKALDLKVGMECYAIVKATNVMIGVED